MPDYYTHIPQEVALAICKKLKIKTFVETGTYEGWSSLWATEFFDEVYTIEASPEMYAVARKHFEEAGKSNDISIVFGDSREVLEIELWNVISRQPCFIWLDAHWFHFDKRVAGQAEDVPLMDELRTILSTPDWHLIVIDDAPLISKRMSERDDNYKQWPTWDMIQPLIQGRYNGWYTGNCLVLEPKEKI